MKLLKAEMNKETAQEILSWQYEPPYDFYNNESCDSELAELLNKAYFTVLNEKEETVGFFCTGESAQVPSGNRYEVYKEQCIDVGLGMNPALVGKGNGEEFGLFILHSIEETHHQLPVRLTVAAFNKRAIRLYEKLGFTLDKRFSNAAAEFITMVKKY
ncbi:RimJ/RimL family protein N-acetyltransferase [Planomicrobium stackebrandtii]|uniref:RimJ/RimL family protein N-acetyltransferase n=1 Tax=Planomicrobium stackebrandtii TaxID=253160 RepID=A0ABU0GZD8_9BACL|nr:GNAT family protein [Planomicrobium stackebrandtii]MDQ0430314.1 RimJ/RimL family protein N-acetyltransferase [Planomicrobium stackebrandtii]